MIYAPYRIRKPDVKLNSIKKGKSRLPDSPSFIWDMILKSHDFQTVDMLGIIAANRNSALTTEKNDILNFLGSYFLSIGGICKCIFWKNSALSATSAQASNLLSQLFFILQKNLDQSQRRQRSHWVSNPTWRR